MRFKNYFINLLYIFLYLTIIGLNFSFQDSYAQGFNNNEWIFGYCEGENQTKVISFGKGANPIVRPRSGALGSNNSAVAVDPITGNVIFYTDGVLVYDGKDNPMYGLGSPGLDGNNQEGSQTVAIGILEYDPEGEKLFYTFYISPSGQLQYAVIDMNDIGEATGSQPPLGAIIERDQLIGNASGPIAVVKTQDSPSYLISYEDGNLVSRGLTDEIGEFDPTNTFPFPFEPKNFVFDEESGTLIIIPTDPNQDIQIIDFDPATGEFGEINPVPGSGNGTQVNGVTYSPDGSYLYFSRGNELLRVPVDDLGATPESVPLDNDIEEIFDIKVGPNGKLYFIYKDPASDALYVGVLNNPDEEELLELEVDEDPFNGTDFCGTAFPQFAPNADFERVVDFTWEPEMPCQNNPIQFTSTITPANYRPVSFEWEFSPALVDEDGEEIEADYDQEHFLMPAEATADQTVTATLTVTFADGTTRQAQHTINLTENQIQAEFTPQDTTVCEGTCVDIASLLEASMGDDQQGGGGVGGGGGMDNLEYFWSDMKDRGWGPKERECVQDKPGLYWVLVRDPTNPECTAYASIRINVWDIQDPKNNIWYFGDGAGLDFNIDPDDPDGPLPRPIEQPHPSQIPAGVTTISDAGGEVLFYSDGVTVWDANGVELATDIGGDNQASQSVLAVAVPQDETLYYLFTIGNGQAKFTTVDIKGSTEAGFGSVPTQDNFLFSPSTEKMAAAGPGDPTWVLFHELGNNTFRAYPVTAQGIGQPVFSSVGSTHGHDSGEVGAMKFSQDGSRVAVTIRDGGTNRLEIFDFDSETGELTEYALLDLGSDGEVYGVEFSNDGSRVYVSYTGGNSRVEEFVIEPIDDDCPACFDESSSRAEREECIMSTRAVVSTAGPFGALQIGPDGQVYVARPGSTVIGQIQTLEDCSRRHFYNDQAHLPMPGVSQLGLPAFVNMDGSMIPEPALDGPDRLCLDPEQGVVGLFEGGGEPDIDTYTWIIRNQAGQEVYTETGGEESQFLEYIFPLGGTYNVYLSVDRCGSFYEDFDMDVLVVEQPEIILPSDVVLCAGEPVTLTAVDPEDPRFDEYEFEWRNAAGELVGDTNEIEVDQESIYTVTVSFRMPEGETEETFATCPNSKSAFVGPEYEFEVAQSDEEVCYGELVTFTPDAALEGDWFAVLEGEEDRIPLGTGYELELDTEDLPSAGNYQIIFVTVDPINEDCPIEKTNSLRVNPQPEFVAESTNPDVDCDNPNGVIEITILNDIQSLIIEELELEFTALTAGQVITIDESLVPGGILPGVYSLLGNNGDCEYTRTVRVENANPPEDFEFSVQEELDCEMEGGFLVLTFPAGPQTGSYEITREGDGQKLTGSFTPADFDGNDLLIENLTEGIYAVELFTADDCPVPAPDDSYEITFTPVEFTIPSEASTCGEYVLRPSTSQELIFTVTDAGGSVIPEEANGTFLLGDGTFTIRGELADPDGAACPFERTITVTVEEEVLFGLIEPDDECIGPLVYAADIGDRAPGDLIFRWRNEAGQLVSRSQTFTPAFAGDYTLEVALQRAPECIGAPRDFTVLALPTPVGVELSAPSSCASEGTVITASGNFREGLVFRWFLGSDELPFYDGLTEITAADGGTYTVQIYNEVGCFLGEDDIQLFVSDIVPPVLEDVYTICAIEDFTVTIDPGAFDSYEWRLEGETVSQDSVYTPTQPGEYTLIVRDANGCEAFVDFVIEEDCVPRIITPTAMRLSVAQKNFAVFVNEFVNEVEVLIFNRWGELIHVDKTLEAAPGEPLLEWDGKVRGQEVPIGTYPVIIRFRSIKQNLQQEVRRAIVVLD